MGWKGEWRRRDSTEINLNLKNLSCSWWMRAQAGKGNFSLHVYFRILAWLLNVLCLYVLCCFLPLHLLDVKMNLISQHKGWLEAQKMELYFSLFTIHANIMSQKVDAPQSKMSHSVVWVVFLPKNFLFTTDYQIQQDMGATLAVLQKGRSQSP